MHEPKKSRIPYRLISIILAIFLLLGLVADVLMFGIFSDQLDKAFPGSNLDQDKIDAATANALSVARSIQEEGAVLLKNNGALPLSQSGCKINLLGVSSYNPVFGGTGSGGSSYTANRKDYVQALTEAGFEINPALIDLYSSNKKDAVNTFSVDFSINELPATEELALDMGSTFAYTGNCSFDALKEYSDTAIIVFSRKGGEGNDLPVSMTEWTSYAPDQNKHYLELNSAELSLLDQAKATFNKVIVLINSGNTMELGFLEEGTGSLDSTGDIDAAMWIGDPGDVGSIGVANLLTGIVNPSGRTPDIYPYEVESTPSFYNFDTFEFTNSSSCFENFDSHPAYLVEYQEGIYVGYRYYETRSSYEYTSLEGEQRSGLKYDDIVQFPFGYGLSYTTFDWDVTAPVGHTLSYDDTLTFTVEVTNTGSVPGKDVVELYYSAPYYSAQNGGSGIQKSAVVLGGFAKTDLLAPGESQQLTIELPVEQMASYDDLRYYSTTGSYVLEAGDYTISLRTDSHNVKNNFAYRYTLADTIAFADPDNASAVGRTTYVGKRSSDQIIAENQFDDVAGTIAYLNRDTWEIIPGSSREATQDELDAFRNALVIDDSYVDPDDVAPTWGAQNGVELSDLRGLSYDDPKWQKLLDELTLTDAYNMLGANGWGSAEAASIGKVQTADMDGPSGLNYILDAFMGKVSYKTVSYPCQVLIAASWNTVLATAYGDSISREGEAWGISGWYAPGCNTHRTPFLGRNFEYFSEDGYLAGVMAAHIIQKAEENGMYCYMKHFALNERETWRHYGLCTFANEQSMRELYFVPFEMGIKNGGSTAIMSSYNNLGTTWAGASTALLTNVLRDEWGFVGTVLTDNNEEHGFMDIEKAVLAGGTSLLFGWGVKTFDHLSKTATGQLLIREAAHQYLYTIANSYVVDIHTPIAPWRIAAVAGSATVYLAAAVWFTFCFRRRKALKASN